MLNFTQQTMATSSTLVLLLVAVLQLCAAQQGYSCTIPQTIVNAGQSLSICAPNAMITSLVSYNLTIRSSSSSPSWSTLIDNLSRAGTGSGNILFTQQALSSSVRVALISFRNDNSFFDITVSGTVAYSATTSTTAAPTAVPTTIAPAPVPSTSRYSGEWSLTSCSPASSTTCSNYPIAPQTYYVADTQQNYMYAVPYGPAVGAVTNFRYSGATISFPLSNCVGTWNDGVVSATCADNASLRFTCSAGPCKSTPTTPNANLAGTWLRQSSYCKSYNSQCTDFFDTSYTITVGSQSLTLQPSSSQYFTATLASFSDGSGMIASAASMCYSRVSPSNKYFMRVICGYPSGSWAEVDFACTSGSCVGRPLNSAVMASHSIAAMVMAVVAFMLF